MPTYLNFSRVFLTCKNIAIRMDGLEVRPALTTSSGKASLQRVRQAPKVGFGSRCPKCSRKQTDLIARTKEYDVTRTRNRPKGGIACDVQFRHLI